MGVQITSTVLTRVQSKREALIPRDLLHLIQTDPTAKEGLNELLKVPAVPEALQN